MQLCREKHLFRPQLDCKCLIQEAKSDFRLADAHVSGGEVAKVEWPQKDSTEFLCCAHRIAHSLDSIARIIASCQCYRLAKTCPVLIGCHTMLDAIADGIIGSGSERPAFGPESSAEKRLDEKDIGCQWYVTG